MSDSAAQELFDHVYELAPGRAPREALRLGEEQASAIRERHANPYDAETCRLLSLCALHPTVDDFVLADRWRVRATARFALVQWPEGIAATFMSQAFTTLARANADYEKGRTLDVIVGSTEPLLVLDELVPFSQLPSDGVTVGKSSPGPQLIERFLHEKRGFFELLLKRYDDARASYERAAVAARGSVRGEVKVRAGAALVEYVAARAAGGDGAAGIRETQAALAGAQDGRQEDIVEQATQNLAVMRAGGDKLVPYELL